MKLKQYWKSIKFPERKLFAARAGTTVGYIKRHLVKNPPSRQPSPRLLIRLADASEGNIHRFELYEEFYSAEALGDSSDNPTHDKPCDEPESMPAKQIA